jgi:hypothetical protein
MIVQIRIQVLAIKVADRVGVLGVDASITDMFGNDRAISARRINFPLQGVSHF